MSRNLIIGTSLLGFTVAVVWLGAPLIPAVLGAVGAGLLAYYRFGRGPR